MSICTYRHLTSLMPQRGEVYDKRQTTRASETEALLLAAAAFQPIGAGAAASLRLKSPAMRPVLLLLLLFCVLSG